jgi:hypothetical protein
MMAMSNVLAMLTSLARRSAVTEVFSAEMEGQVTRCPSVLDQPVQAELGRPFHQGIGELAQELDILAIGPLHLFGQGVGPRIVPFENGLAHLS